VGHHLIDLGLFLLLALAPLPLCLSLLLAPAGQKPLAGPGQGCAVVLASWFLVQTIVGLVLGLVHAFTPAGAVAGEAVVLAVGTLALRRARQAAARLPLAAFLAGGQALQPSHLLVLGPLACLGIALLWTVSVQPINEWDSLAYHLPTLAGWYQTGHFARLEPHTSLTSAYPCGWEVLAALFLIPFHEDFLVAVPNLMAWVLLGLSVYCISRQLGATTTAGLAGAALTMTIPCVAESVNSIHVDIGLGAGFLAGLYFAILYRESRSRKWLGLALAATGMVIGVKTSGLLYGALLLAMLLATGLRRGAGRPRVPEGERSPAWPIVVAGMCYLLFAGGLWYVRNWIELGNPLAPVAISLGRALRLPGSIQHHELREATLLRMLYQPSPSYWRAFFAEAPGWLGPSFAAVALMALSGLLAFLVPRKTVAHRTLPAALALAAAALVLHLVTPFSGSHISNLRYATPFYGLLAVAGAVGATASGIPGLVLVAAVLVGVVARLLVLRTIVALALLPALWAFLRLVRTRGPALAPRWTRRTAVLAAVIAISATALVSFLARRERAEHRTIVYGPISQFMMTTVQPDERVGYLMSYQSYLLYGTDFRHQVVYIPLRSRDRDTWLHYLRRRGIALVAIGPTPAGSADRQFQDWLEGPSGPLVRVFGTDPNRPCLYRVRPAGQ